MKIFFSWKMCLAAKLCKSECPLLRAPDLLGWEWWGQSPAHLLMGIDPIWTCWPSRRLESFRERNCAHFSDSRQSLAMHHLRKVAGSFRAVRWTECASTVCPSEVCSRLHSLHLNMLIWLHVACRICLSHCTADFLFWTLMCKSEGRNHLALCEWNEKSFQPVAL